MLHPARRAVTMDKKGVQLSLQTMVVAALVLIVLVILIALVLRQTGIFQDSINACGDRGEAYTCKSTCDNDEQIQGKCGQDDENYCCVDRQALTG